MKDFGKWVVVTGIACAWIVTSSMVMAHEGPESEVDELTERIKVEGESADLLLQRAIEYNVLRKGAEAVKDLEKALTYETQSPMVFRELSRAYFSIGKTNEAIDAAGRGLKVAREEAEKASLYVTRASVYRAQKEYQKALDDVDKALKEHPDNVEAYMSRSQLQQVLDLKKERIKGLEAGIKETGSGLLQSELIDALIDGDKLDAAMKTIQAELKDARVRSTWLMRRARVYRAQYKWEDAKTDLEEALEEINKRLGRGASDPLLLADRGQVYEMLGEREEAKKDYQKAREKGVTDEWLRERLRELGGEEGRRGRGRRGENRAAEEKKEDGAKEEDKDKDDEK